MSEMFLILRRIERDVIKMCIGLHVKYPLFLLNFNELRTFWTDFRKKINFQKIGPLGAELFHSDGRTDMMMLTVAVRNVS